MAIYIFDLQTGLWIMVVMHKEELEVVEIIDEGNAAVADVETVSSTLVDVAGNAMLGTGNVVAVTAEEGKVASIPIDLVCVNEGVV